MAGRTATCTCGRLKVEADGEPSATSLCACYACQTRTGSVYGVNAFFPQDKVRITGESKAFTRSSDSGRNVTFHFCVECGTTLYWEAEARPGMVGVAVGAFKEAAFPMPPRGVFIDNKISWVTLPEGMATLGQGPPRPPKA